MLAKILLFLSLSVFSYGSPNSLAKEMRTCAWSMHYRNDIPPTAEILSLRKILLSPRIRVISWEAWWENDHISAAYRYDESLSGAKNRKLFYAIIDDLIRLSSASPYVSVSCIPDVGEIIDPRLGTGN